MIDRDEIEVKSKELDVHVANVERDYVFGWLLKAIYENNYLSKILIFKGGNCFRKAYYPETRFSSDLDFSVESQIDADKFIDELNKSCLSAQEECGVLFEIEKNVFKPEYMIDATKQAFKGTVYFKDFYGNGGNISISVKFDVTEFDRLLLNTRDMALVHPYSDSNLCSAIIRCMALEELVANKLKCLLQRRHSHDLYDLAYATFFNNSMDLDRSLVLSTFLKKTIFSPSPSSAKELLLGVPASFFEGAWEKFIIPKDSRFSFRDAFDGFSAFVEELFVDIRDVPWKEKNFYPSKYRNLIMEAGAGRKLLLLGYGGVKREVEPYALKYMRRRDGVAQEYLYAYDCTGGTSSAPGIKMFLHPRIESLEISDKRFDPKHPIELSKSGEKVKKDYFGGGSSRRRGVGRRGTKGFSAGVKYVIQCPYCQKKFRRNTYSTKLNKHKDSNGYPCRARVGYLVSTQ